MSKLAMGIKIFVVYSHTDEKLKQMLDVQLTILKHQGYISGWFNGKITPGENWDEALQKEMETTGMILMLVSPGFMKSGYFKSPGFEKALELYKQHKAKVIPVILEECNWQEKIKLPGLEVLPDNGKAASDNNSWYSFEAAFTNVLKGLKRIIRPVSDDDRFLGADSNFLTRLLNGSKKYYDLIRGPNGRFRYLNISDIILPSTKSHWLETQVSMPEPQGTRPPGDTEQETTSLLEYLPLLWNQEVKHAVVMGEGGMGKTVSLLRWWEQLLEPGETAKPVPVFIALNEFNQVPEGKREDFIMVSVLKNYGGNDRESFTAAEVKKTMKTPLTTGSNFIPSIVLLLDGFNEITVEKKELLLELNYLAEQCPGIQVAITSRYDMRGNFNWDHWNLVRLRELGEEKVDAYLQGIGLAVPGQGRLRELLGNPMMLALYATSYKVQERHRDSRYCCFKETVETPGELLWNFIDAQVAKLPERVGPDEEQVVYYWFLLKYLLPGLGYEMEKAGLFAFTYGQFQERIDLLYRRFSRDDFLDTFPQLGKYEDMLSLGESADGSERRKRAARLRDIFCHQLHMLVEKGQSLRFLHQDFRYFFAALHVLNEVEISLNKDEIPRVLKERILDYFVRRLVGEIQGEHRIKPYLEEKAGWAINIDKENRLHRVLDLCRGKFGEEVGYAVWNLVTIWKEVRGELSGADLSGLDLSGIPLNGARCSRFYEDRYLAAIFDGSRVHEKNLLPQGHTNVVRSAVYSPDGKKILSASEDQTIKEWNVSTGQCVKTMAGHTDKVLSAVYSPDGKKILSTSSDRTIKEWDTETGQCVKTLAGHTDSVFRAVYSPDGKKIFSASADQTVKEWDVATGKCLKTHQKKDNPQIPAYPPNHKNIELRTEGNKIYVPDASAKDKERELINIPGLFIQGCSFQNLEKGSEWTEEGLAILKQYHAIV